MPSRLNNAMRQKIAERVVDRVYAEKFNDIAKKAARVCQVEVARSVPPTARKIVKELINKWGYEKVTAFVDKKININLGYWNNRIKVTLSKPIYVPKDHCIRLDSVERVKKLLEENKVLVRQRETLIADVVTNLKPYLTVNKAIENWPELKADIEFIAGFERPKNLPAVIDHSVLNSVLGLKNMK